MSLKPFIKKLLKPSKIKLVGVLAFLLLTAGVSASIASNAAATGDTTPQATDCSVEADNSVIYTGAPSISSLVNSYDNGDGHNVKGSIPNIYDWYSVGGLSTSQKIDSAEIHGMSASNTVTGTVTNTNDVYVGTKLVATDAITGGRCNITGSQTQDSNGTTFYSRPPSVSFLSSSLSALVVMKDGVFQFAIINSCGNAVEATPVTTTPPAPKVPNYTITKDVSYQGKGWVHEVTAPVNGVVQYKIDVTSTGTAPVTHVFVNDAISANIQYVPNTLKLNGNPVGDASAKDFFSKGLQIAGLNPGDSAEITFDAKVGVLYTTENCKPGPYINNAFVNASQLPQMGASALVDEKCVSTPPPETLVCNNLTFNTTGPAESDGSTPYRFVGSATPTNAKITSYTFVLKDSTTGKTIYTKTIKGGGTRVPFNYTLPLGSYDANLTVSGIGNDGHAFTDITSTGCAQHITVSSTPVCTAPNGSTYPQGSPQCSPTCTVPSGTTYPQGSPQCTPTCTTPSGQTVPAGSSACTPGSTCTTSTGQTFPAGSSECETTPTTLVNTGPGDIIGLFAAASLSGAAAHWYLTLRRARRSF